MVGLDTPDLRRLVKKDVETPIEAGIWHEIEIGKVSLSIRIEEVVHPLLLSSADKEILRSHRLITQGRDGETSELFEPFGWKQSGGLLSMYGNVPGNTLPIIWANGYINPWLPLRERYFNPFTSKAKIFGRASDLFPNSEP